VALSAGNYSFALANDDLHKPDRTGAIAVRSNFLYTPSAGYNDVKQSLTEGSFYAMRTPDYGDGDWDIKRAKNRDIPYIKNIGTTERSEIFISLSDRADSIKVFGQNHTTLLAAYGTDSVGYMMKENDPYGRFTVYFSQGEVIYSNPFARYDASVASTPFNSQQTPVNIPLTLLFNISLALAAVGIVVLYKMIFLW
jgi:hypothetical protein